MRVKPQGRKKVSPPNIKEGAEDEKAILEVIDLGREKLIKFKNLKFKN